MDLVCEGSTLVVRGDFDARGSAAVRHALYDLLRRTDGDVVVDLSGVDRVDVIALRVLAGASRHARTTSRRRRVVLRGCRPSVRRLLHLTHLIRVVTLERAAAGAETGRSRTLRRATA